jgi:hypothetical protein
MSKRKFRAETNRTCECGSGLPVLTHSRFCVSCEAYNAAVKAVRAAAECFASTRCREHVAGGAWINEHGCFAASETMIGIQVASPEEVAPFVALTGAARKAAQLEAVRKWSK